MRRMIVCVGVCALACSVLSCSGEKAEGRGDEIGEDDGATVIDAGPPTADTAAPRHDTTGRTKPEPVPARQPADAAVAPTKVDPDLHFDSYSSSYRPYRPGEQRPRNRRGEEIELLLRSNPPGASAAVDGKPLGNTPVLWRTAPPHAPVEFTFVLPGYAMARYRFVPTRSGIVHGTLKKLAAQPADAGPQE